MAKKSTKSNLAEIVACAYEIYGEDFTPKANVKRAVKAAVYGMGSENLPPEVNMGIAWTALSDILEIEVEEFMERAMDWYNAE